MLNALENAPEEEMQNSKIPTTLGTIKNKLIIGNHAVERERKYQLTNSIFYMVMRTDSHTYGYGGVVEILRKKLFMFATVSDKKWDCIEKEVLSNAHSYCIINLCDNMKK